MVKAVIEPRTIIVYVVFKYLNESEKELVRKNVLTAPFKSDCKFVNSLEVYFDFFTLINKPQIHEDAWIFNYLMYETKYPEKGNPLKKGEQIKFSGKMPKKGLIVKYSNFLKKPILRKQGQPKPF